MPISLLQAAPIVLAMAGGAVCERPPPPEIIVRPVTTDVTVDNSRSIDELSSFEVETTMPDAFDGGEVHGLMQGAISLTTTTLISWKIDNVTDQACFWFDKIELEIRLEPFIYVGKETKPGSCRYREVYNHEVKHVNVDRRIVNEYVPIFKQSIQDFVNQRPVFGPYPANLTQDIRKQMTGALRLWYEPVQINMDLDRASEQMDVDTVEEYRRVANACPDEKKRSQNSRHRHNSVTRGLY